MKVGVISDVHSNLVALEAVLEDMPEVDRLVCAGDVVGYNPWPAECVEAVRERGIPTVMGNHDRMVTSGRNFRGNSMAKAGVELARDRLNDVQREWLAELPRERVLFDGRLKLVHDHPEIQDKYTYPEEFSPSLLGGEDVLVLGHTHVQHHEVYDEGVVLNPGSVGQPRDRDPDAAYAVLDLDGPTVEQHRVPYDIERVAGEVQNTPELPADTAQRLFSGR